MTSIPFKAYLELTKPRIAVMVLVTTAFGYILAAGGIPEPWTFFILLVGTAGVGGGASALNQYLEREVDGQMHRTRQRPLPAGVLSPGAALYFGVVLVMGGCLLLLWKVNILTAFLALQSTFLYVLVYTPMKRLSWWNTSVGAIPGAIPPLMGWAGATGHLAPAAWVLFFILYFWQHPHFFAIAWIYREDYARGGFKMLPVVHPDGKATGRQAIGFSILLIAVSIMPTLLGISGYLYGIGALACGLVMLAYSIMFSVKKSDWAARKLLRVSLVYLPLIFVLISIDMAF